MRPAIPYRSADGVVEDRVRRWWENGNCVLALIALATVIVAATWSLPLREDVVLVDVLTGTEKQQTVLLGFIKVPGKVTQSAMDERLVRLGVSWTPNWFMQHKRSCCERQVAFFPYETVPWPLTDDQLVMHFQTSLPKYQADPGYQAKGVIGLRQSLWSLGQYTFPTTAPAIPDAR